MKTVIPAKDSKSWIGFAKKECGAVERNFWLVFLRAAFSFFLYTNGRAWGLSRRGLGQCGGKKEAFQDLFSLGMSTRAEPESTLPTTGSGANGARDCQRNASHGNMMSTGWKRRVSTHSSLR